MNTLFMNVGFRITCSYKNWYLLEIISVMLRLDDQRNVGESHDQLQIQRWFTLVWGAMRARCSHPIDYYSYRMKHGRCGETFAQMGPDAKPGHYDREKSRKRSKLYCESWFSLIVDQMFTTTRVYSLEIRRSENMHEYTQSSVARHSNRKKILNGSYRSIHLSKRLWNCVQIMIRVNIAAISSISKFVARARSRSRVYYIRYFTLIDVHEFNNIVRYPRLTLYVIAY